jgi:hypothetical protein
MMPSSQQNSYGGDEIRARDGTACRQGNHIGPTLDFGITASKNNTETASGQSPIINNYNYNNVDPGMNSNNNSLGGDVGVYARVVIPLGSEPERVDCTVLYNLEIERLQLELKRLKESGSASVTVD